MASLRSAGVKRQHRFSKVVGQALESRCKPRWAAKVPAAVLLRSRMP
jgi:hypothetical protein